jgi:(1->4)-alpha-D-glucan 1-alpha-D-glucosylmutase
MWKHEVDGDPAPSAADEHQLYQTMVGAWPSSLDPEDRTGLAGFVGRLQEWFLKAMREAKQKTDWGVANESYEKAAIDFLHAVLDPERSAPFAREVAAVVERLRWPGLVKSLSQLAVKCLTTGVPDFYQGTELWDLSLVDPDNRRAVDFGQRARSLALEASLIPADLGGWFDGTVKQAVMRRLLSLRVAMPELFLHGRYRPLALSGDGQADFIAYALSREDQAVLVVAPRLTARLAGSEPPHLRQAPDSVRLGVPPEWAGAECRSVLTDEAIALQRRMPLSRLGDGLPLKVLWLPALTPDDRRRSVRGRSPDPSASANSSAAASG